MPRAKNKKLTRPELFNRLKEIFDQNHEIEVSVSKEVVPKKKLPETWYSIEIKG